MGSTVTRIELSSSPNENVATAALNVWPEAEQGQSDLAGGLMRDITAQESGTLSALVTVRTRHGRRGGGGRT